MRKDSIGPSSLMARLTLSAINKAAQDSSCWKQQVVYRALLVSGLSVLLASLQILEEDLGDLS